MPEYDGFEFLRFRQNEERYSNIPVIVTTVSESLHDEIECLELGSNDFVVKPYDVRIILNRIRNTIKLRETASIVNQLTWDKNTNLYSTEFFYRRVNDLLLAFPDRAYDIVVTDIRNFKSLNERYGREHCDQLLRDLAARLTAILPDVEAGGRVGGDSFAFLIGHNDGKWTETIDSVIRNLTSFHLFVKFGVVEDVDHHLTASQLCDRAFIAMADVRGAIGAGVGYYDDDLRYRQEIEQVVIESMNRGLDEHQFLVYYQPKHDVRSGSIAGAEALVRWEHPELGLVSPLTFISIFEKHGLITNLDLYVCEEVCREIRRCEDLGLPLVPISINISRLDFDDPELAEKIISLATKFGIDCSLLHVELTETAYSEDPETVVNALNKLRSAGFLVELDDFGSGYSSLASLNTIPLDILKLDGSMIRHAVEHDDFRVIQSAIQIAQLLGLETVVEGVETEAEIDKLKEMGCDLIQGMFYSWPLRQEDFEGYLAR